MIQRRKKSLKKKLPQTLETIKKHFIPASEHSRKIRYWCGDESRLGLKTEEGRLITLTGIKPLGLMQWRRENFYLYGLVEPLTGEFFIWEFSHLNTMPVNEI